MKDNRSKTVMPLESDTKSDAQENKLVPEEENDDYSDDLLEIFEALPTVLFRI